MDTVHVICTGLLLLLQTSVLVSEKNVGTDLVIVVLSQPEGYHAAHAKLLRDQIKEQADALETEPPSILLTHELYLPGAWTIFPLLSILLDKFPKAKWFFFCLDNTGIRLGALREVLSSMEEEKEIWVGHALYNSQPTIIHHFAEHPKKFKYPNIASGFAMTRPLLQSLRNRIEAEGPPQEDFHIDGSYEFAKFVFNEGKGVRFSHLRDFCVVSSKTCATFPRFFQPCSDALSRDKIFFAVKTWSKNHVDRVPIVMKTWLKHVPHFGLFSNQTDKNLPNIHIVPNTDRGHCSKTRAILQKSYEILLEKNMNWLVVADDDTIFSIARLTRLLTCYNPLETVALGERYGYRGNFDYLTGGAGVVLSTPLVKEIIESEFCECPTADAPDDMFLFGMCLKLLGVEVTHSPLFHQARPMDYAISYLASQEPISFHKFWEIDPLEVYEQWFAEADRAWKFIKPQHTEL